MDAPDVSPTAPRAGALERLEARLARPRVEPACVAVVVALAFALRLAHVLAYRDSPFFDAPQMDALYHLEWARAFAGGETFQQGPFFRAPLYPWFLGLALKLFGPGLLLPRILQAGLGAVTTGLVYLTGREAFDRRTGLLASLLAATYWVLIFYDGEFLLEVLATPLYLLGLWLTLRLANRPGRGASLLAGLAWGLGAITRPNVLVFLPAALGWVAWRGRRTGSWAPGLLFAAGIALPILPITLTNLAQGDRVLIASQGGVNLWIGNNPDSDGSTAVVPGTREDWWGGYHDAIALAERSEGRELRPSEVSRHYVGRALGFVREQPGSWARQMAWKLRLFVCDWEIGNNQEVRFLAHRFDPLLRWLPLGFGILAPFALLGILVSLRGGCRRLPLWAFLVLYSGSVVLFFVNARFRLPVLPVLAIYAAHGAGWLATELLARRFGRAALAALGLALAIAGSRTVPPRLERNSTSNGWLMLATAEARAGRFEEAVQLFDRALEAWPGNGIAHRGLGISRLRLGQAELAERSFRAALQARSDDLYALSGMLDLQLGRGRLDEAGATVARMLQAAPGSGLTLQSQGRLLFMQDDLQGAERSFDRALRTDPTSFAAAYSLAATQDRLGRPREAAESYDRATTLEPLDDARFVLQAALRAAELYLAQQPPRTAAASQVLRRARQRFPDDPRLAQALERLGRRP